MKRNTFMAVARRIRENGMTTIKSKFVTESLIEYLIQALKGHFVTESDGDETVFTYA